MIVRSLDHLVLTVKDIDQTVEFYTKILGMKKKSFGEDRVALHFGEQKINLHQIDKVVDKNVLHATCGSSDICLITDSSIEQITSHLKNHNINLLGIPSQRTGACGPINSVYFYDLDENLIELSTYK